MMTKHEQHEHISVFLFTIKIVADYYMNIYIRAEELYWECGGQKITINNKEKTHKR